MYLHEIYRTSHTADIRHYRQTKLPSGLITLEELARTQAMVAAPANTTVPGKLIIAHSSKPQSTEAPLPAKSVECADIPSFINDGVAAWEETLTWLGGGACRVSLAHAERRRFEEETTPSGLIIASSEPQVPEFEGYYATTDEMVALETMTNRINDSLAPVTDDTPVGNYL